MLAAEVWKNASGWHIEVERESDDQWNVVTKIDIPDADDHRHALEIAMTQIKKAVGIPKLGYRQSGATEIDGMQRFHLIA